MFSRGQKVQLRREDGSPSPDVFVVLSRWPSLAQAMKADRGLKQLIESDVFKQRVNDESVQGAWYSIRMQDGRDILAPEGGMVLHVCETE